MLQAGRHGAPCASSGILHVITQARTQVLPVRYVQRDRNGKFAPLFDAALKSRHVKRIRSPRCAPNAQAFVERFIGSLRRECLHHFIFFGAAHLTSVAKTWLDHYHAERPHQGKENELLVKPPGREQSKISDKPIALSDIRCTKRLGGLLKSYSRKAA